MEKQFKVGQVWRTRDGGEATIQHIDNDGVFPIWTDIDSHTVDGSASTVREDGNDLIELITDVAEVSPAPELATEPAPQPEPEMTAAPKKFAAGQVWRNRDGKQVTIDNVLEVGGLTFPIRDTEGELYTIDGNYHSDSVTESGFDLVELIADPSAPAIADAMIADAAGLAGDPPPTLRTPEDFAAVLDAVMGQPQPGAEAAPAGDQDAQSPLRPMNDGDLALFDRLVIDMGASNAIVQMENIRKIIEARRAL